MGRPRGRRSSRDVLEGWRCSKKKHLNLPEKHEFFDTPTLVCGCGCNQQYGGDFDFSLSEIIVNDHKLLGEPMYQTPKLCMAFAFAKQMEITKRVRALLLNKKLLDSPVMDAIQFVADCERIFGGALPLGSITALIMMAQQLKTKGIVNKDRTTISKASDVSIIKETNVAEIVGALADGFPLNADFGTGKRFDSMRYCRPYKPPSFQKLWEKSGGTKPIPGHAVVLVGAGRKKGRLYYYFMNSHKRFCVRRDKFGRVIRTGIGKIDAKRLRRSVIRISRFKEPPTAKSLVFPQNMPVEPNCHNSLLLR